MALGIVAYVGAAEGVGSYGDMGQDAAPILGADRDEIGAGGGIVVCCQTDLFACGEIHGGDLRSEKTMRARRESAGDS